MLLISSFQTQIEMTMFIGLCQLVQATGLKKGNRMRIYSSRFGCLCVRATMD